MLTIACDDKCELRRTQSIGRSRLADLRKTAPEYVYIPLSLAASQQISAYHLDLSGHTHVDNIRKNTQHSQTGHIFLSYKIIAAPTGNAKDISLFFPHSFVVGVVKSHMGSMMHLKMTGKLYSLASNFGCFLLNTYNTSGQCYSLFHSKHRSGFHYQNDRTGIQVSNKTKRVLRSMYFLNCTISWRLACTPNK